MIMISLISGANRVGAVALRDIRQALVGTTGSRDQAAIAASS
jgi:hypothetical protein